MADETKEVLESVAPVLTQSVPLNTIKSQQAAQVDLALVNINAKRAKKINGPVALPTLPEITVTGYTKGPTTAKQVLCCIVGKHIIEKNTAYDFIMMAALASQQGINLFINEAWRSNERQTQLYQERSNALVRAKKGQAAPPGYSNHQSGIALDIEAGISKERWVAGVRHSPVFDWLTENAPKFGFNHKEGEAASESWHWVHPEKKVIGATAFEQATGFPVLIAETALAASALNQSGVTRLAYLGVHDETVGRSRSISMTQSTQNARKACLAESSLFCANQSNGLSSTISQVEGAIASTTTLDAEPKAFSSDTLRPFSYDFATGTWDDGKAV